MQNRLFDEIATGDEARLERSAPAGAGGAWLAALLGELVEDRLPGAGCRWLGQSLEFREPPVPGEAVTALVRVAERDAQARSLVLDCRCCGPQGQVLLQGRATIRPAAERMQALAPSAEGAAAGPALRVTGQRPHFLQDLAERARAHGPLRMGVVHPVDANALCGMADAAQAGLVEPVVFGPRRRIEAAAEECGADISGYELVDTAHSHEAAERAVAAVRDGVLAALMKGSLHTDELMAAIVDRQCGLTTDRRISHAFCLDVPLYPRPLFVADAAINISPDLMQKRDITQNAIDLAQAVGVGRPKVAILAAVETVTPRMIATIDAASLCKMADRGQITGAELEGPLAFDNAVSLEAAQSKKIRSEVAGLADILIVPDIEAGNMVAKQLEYLAGAQSAGLVMGARVPVVLTSRADGPAGRLASCALAVMLAHARAEGLLQKPAA